MQIRKLKLTDAPLMLEWMKDENVIDCLQKEKFLNMTIENCEKFIDNSLVDENNCHLAIVSDDDEYLGTVSLKNIDMNDKSAEFAITVRTKAMGTGASKYGMQEIIEYGFNKLGLNEIYWNVKKDNARAVRFYDKNGYEKMQNVSEERLNLYKDVIESGVEFYWYHVVNK